MRDAVSANGRSEIVAVLRHDYRSAAQHGAEQNRQSTDVVQRKRQQPAIVGTEGNILARAERAIIMIAISMQRCLGLARAARGENDADRLHFGDGFGELHAMGGRALQ